MVRSNFDSRSSYISLTPTVGLTDVTKDQGSFEIEKERGRKKASLNGSEAEAEIESTSSDTDDTSHQLLPLCSTYVCSLHDPKQLLKEEQLGYDRIQIKLKDSIRKRSLSRKSSSEFHPFALSSRRDSNVHIGGGKAYSDFFTYVISLGGITEEFTCTPSQVLELYRSINQEKHLVNKLQFIQSKYLEEGFLGSLKRFWAAPHKLAEEIGTLLESLSDIDLVVVKPSFQKLVGAEMNEELKLELETFLHKRTCSPRSNLDYTCMCDMYRSCIEGFGKFLSSSLTEEDCVEMNHAIRIADDYLMQKSHVLAFNTDTVYLLDKKRFRPSSNLEKCLVYGFGRHKLFEMTQVSRKKWILCDTNAVLLLTIEIERSSYNEYPLISINRVHKYKEATTTTATTSSTSTTNIHSMEDREKECICYVRKSRKNRYSFTVLSDFISQGRATTNIYIKQTPTLSNSTSTSQQEQQQEATTTTKTKKCYYSIMSELSNGQEEYVESSSLEVEQDLYQALQILRITGGSDILLYLGISLSLDIISGISTFIRKDRMY